MISSFALTGEVAFVTGAAQGIGEGLAVAFAQAGADVACFDLDHDGARATAGRIERSGRRALALHGDVTDQDAVAGAVAETVSRLGGLSLALNNAGIDIEMAAEEMAVQAFRRVVDVNLSGVFICAQAQARVMLAQGRGSILNIASMSGRITNKGLFQSNYNASKAGVAHLTRSLATEWAARGVRVNALSPGYVLTPMNERESLLAYREQWKTETPMGRMAEVDDLTGPAVFLLSDAARFCTGVDLVVDGGYTCW